MQKKIIEQVSKYYGLTIEDMKLNKSATKARGVLCYLLKEHTDMKISEIGKMLGKDHATVVYGIRRIEGDLRASKELQEEIEELEKMISKEGKSSMDKFWNFFRLETVDNFKPGCTKKVSTKVEAILRMLFWVLTVGIVCSLRVPENIFSFVMILCSGIITTEFLWSGFKGFVYIQDIVLHSLSVMSFVIASLCFEQYLAGLAIMGIAKCFSDFEQRNLYNKDEFSEEVLNDWEGYIARNFKISFLAIGIACLVVFKLAGIV